MMILLFCWLNRQAWPHSPELKIEGREQLHQVGEVRMDRREMLGQGVKCLGQGGQELGLAGFDVLDFT